MLENLPKMLLGIPKNFPYYAWTLSYVLCSIVLTVELCIHIINSINCVYSFELVALTVYYSYNCTMALITTHHLSDTCHNVLYSIYVYVRNYPWKAAEAMYVYTYYCYIIITNFATAVRVAVSAVTWSAIY